MTPNEAIRREFAPFLQSLLSHCDNDPKLQAQLQFWLTKFLDALLDAYDGQNNGPLRAYLTQGLTRYAISLTTALRPEIGEVVSTRSVLTIMDEEGFGEVAVVERREDAPTQSVSQTAATEMEAQSLIKIA